MSDEEVSDGGNPQPELSGWADAMSRILGSNKPQKKKKLILSRAKKDYEVKQSTLEVKKEVVVVKKKKLKPRRENYNFEVVPSENTLSKIEPEPEPEPEPVKEEPKATKRKAAADAKDDPEVSLKKLRSLELKQKRIQKEWENIKRIKPDPATDREAERDLQRIATKGVIELFNAVNLQKKTLGKKLRDAPKSEFKKDKILSQTKDLFEDALEKEHKKKR